MLNLPDSKGRLGRFAGRYAPETVIVPVLYLDAASLLA